MNNKGSVLVALMLATIIFVFALSVANPAVEVTLESTSVMDCSNASISDFQKGSCRIVEITAPLFVASIVALAFGLIGARII